MSEHYVTQCKHGVVLGQCRCPAKDKTVKLGECPPGCAQVSEPIKPATDEQIQQWAVVYDDDSWMPFIRARIESDAAKHAAALKERDEQIAELFDALEEAKEDIESWSAYADEYFQTKHDLAGDIARIDAILARRKEANRG